MPHIPQGTTDTVALELFEPALDAALRPSPDYDVSPVSYTHLPRSKDRSNTGKTTKPSPCLALPSTGTVFLTDVDFCRHRD